MVVVGDGRLGQLVAQVAEHRVDVAPLIDARYPLAEGLAAFAHAQRPGALKVLLQISG